MSDTCEQKILQQIEQDSQPALHHRTWKRNLTAAVAIAACVGIVGMVSVSAIQGTDWIHRLFPNSRDDAAVSQYAAEYAGNVSAFSADLDDLDAELVAAFADETNLYYAIHITPKTNDAEKYTDLFTISPTGNSWINGETNLDLLEAGEYSTEPDGDGYLHTGRIHLDGGSWSDQTVYQEEMQAQLWEGENYQHLKQNYGAIGTISITLDFQTEPTSTVYTATGIWRNDKGFLNIEQVVLQPLTLTIDGTADVQTNRAENVSVILEDGSTVAAEYMQSGYRNYGIATEDLTQVEQFLYLEKPIDPTTVTALQMDDVTIPLDQKSDNTVLDPADMTATISDFTVTGMDDFTITAIGVISDGSNLNMVLNAKPDATYTVSDGSEILPDFTTLQINGEAVPMTGSANCDLGSDGEYVIVCKIQMAAIQTTQADIQFDLKTADNRNTGTVAFHLDQIQAVPGVTYDADGTWQYTAGPSHVTKSFSVDTVTCSTSHIVLTGEMDSELAQEPTTIEVILTDGTTIPAVTSDQYEGAQIHSYGILHLPDGTGVLEYDLSALINPKEVASIQLDDVVIPVTIEK